MLNKGLIPDDHPELKFIEKVIQLSKEGKDAKEIMAITNDDDYQDDRAIYISMDIKTSMINVYHRGFVIDQDVITILDLAKSAMHQKIIQMMQQQLQMQGGMPIGRPNWAPPANPPAGNNRFGG
jgi:uncharacterized membrane protein YdfJ with MMPL/SSD domain